MLDMTKFVIKSRSKCVLCLLKKTLNYLIDWYNNFITFFEVSNNLFKSLKTDLWLCVLDRQ